MPNKSAVFKKRMAQLNQGLDLLLYNFSTYALPLVIGFLFLLALVSWKTQFTEIEPSP